MQDSVLSPIPNIILVPNILLDRCNSQKNRPLLSTLVPLTPAVPLLQFGWKYAIRKLGPWSRTSGLLSLLSQVQLSSHPFLRGLASEGMSSDDSPPDASAVCYADGREQSAGGSSTLKHKQSNI